MLKKKKQCKLQNAHGFTKKKSHFLVRAKQCARNCHPSPRGAKCMHTHLCLQHNKHFCAISSYSCISIRMLCFYVIVVGHIRYIVRKMMLVLTKCEFSDRCIPYTECAFWGMSFQCRSPQKQLLTDSIYVYVTCLKLIINFLRR